MTARRSKGLGPLLLAVVLVAGVACRAGDGHTKGSNPQLLPFTSPLLDEPLIISGDFGEHRSNHFHAGLDIVTHHVVGMAVHAPIDAELRRVRASGVGYGRSLYLLAADGRLLVFGHLDAFAEPIAAYVAAVQDSTGQYEQDLWPERGRFKIKAGTIIAWTGQSGAGGPHLHVEVRNVDMALNPLIAGYSVHDTTPPRLTAVTVVPLDTMSRVAGMWRPKRVPLIAGTTGDVAAWGRLRLVVETWDVGLDGEGVMAPWKIRVASGNDWVECRFDSVSWATDMPQSDYVYDKGRYTQQGKISLVMAAPAGFRPRVISSSAPLDQEAGVFVADAAHAEVPVTITVEDLAGHKVERELRIRAEQPEAESATAAASSSRKTSPGGSSSVSAVMARGTWIEPSSDRTLELSGVARVKFPKEALFEGDRILVEPVAPPKGSAGLRPLGVPIAVRPATTPLRSPVEVSIAVSPADTGKVGLYEDTGDGWEWVGRDRAQNGGMITGRSRRLGRFGVFRDELPPYIKLVTPGRRAPVAPYLRWALEARLSDTGSGIDASESWFEVDGHREPSEWDPEVGTLRWRPLKMPASGPHEVRVIATDHCGNVARANGRFVLE